MSLGGLGSALRYLAIMPVAISLFGMKRMRFNAPLVFYALFVMFSFITLLWAVDPNDSLSAVIGQVMLFALLSSGAMFRYTEKDIEIFKRALAWSSRISAITLIMYGAIVNGRLVLSGIITENPNHLCTYLAFGIMYALERLTAKGAMRKKILPILELVLYFVLVLLTGSRGGLIAVVAGAISMLLLSKKESKVKTIYKLLIIVGVLVAFSFLLNQLPEVLRARFSVDEVIESGGTGRTEIWGWIIEAYNKSNILRQLFGYGAGAANGALRFCGFPAVDSHNAFLHNLLTCGIVGMVLYSLAILGFLKKSLSFKSKFAFSVMLCIFVFTFGASAASLKPYFNVMLFIIISMNIEDPEFKSYSEVKTP